MLWLARTIANADNKNDNPKYREAVGAKASVVGIILNVLLCTGKAGIGVLSGSVSIVADALNNLSDAASNIISLLGFKLAAKPADAGHPYGHGRYEYLASLMVAVIVMPSRRGVCMDQISGRTMPVIRGEFLTRPFQKTEQ